MKMRWLTFPSRSNSDHMLSTENAYRSLDTVRPDGHRFSNLQGLGQERDAEPVLSCIDTCSLPPHQGHTAVSVPSITGSVPHTSAWEPQYFLLCAVAFRSHGSGTAFWPMKAVIRT